MTPRARLELHLSSQLKDEIMAYARREQVALSALGEAAFVRLLHPEPQPEAPGPRPVALLRRDIRALQQAVEVVAETLALFVNVYLSTTPDVPPGEEKTARQRGGRRYTRFLRVLEDKLAGDKRRFPARAPAEGDDDAHDD